MSTPYPVPRWPEVSSAVPEGTATPEMISATTDTGSPAPWLIEGHGVAWIARASRSDVDLLPAELRSGALPVARVAMAVRYASTPVGPYNELGCGLACLRRDGAWLHIPFLPVDSAATMRGGRENWALPKTLATFTGDPEPESSFRLAGDHPQPWSVSLDISRRRGSVPLGVPGPLKWLPAFGLTSLLGIEQVTPDGRRLRAGFDNPFAPSVQVGSAGVDVEVDGSPELRRLLPDGHHRGVAMTYRGVHLAAARVDR